MTNDLRLEQYLRMDRYNFVEAEEVDTDIVEARQVDVDTVEAGIELNIGRSCYHNVGRNIHTSADNLLNLRAHVSSCCDLKAGDTENLLCHVASDVNRRALLLTLPNLLNTHELKASSRKMMNIEPHLNVREKAQLMLPRLNVI